MYSAVLGFHCCVGFSLVAMHWLLIVVASLVPEHGLQSIWALVGLQQLCTQAQQLQLPGSRAQPSSCGAWAQSCSMQDLPAPGTEPVSPALAGGFFATEPPGKPSFKLSKNSTNKLKIVLRARFEEFQRHIQKATKEIRVRNYAYFCSEKQYFIIVK